MVFTIGTAVAFALPAKTEIVKTTYNLEALQDNNSVKGSFFLGASGLQRIINNCYQEYIIYVPKGTIKQNYSLDAQ